MRSSFFSIHSIMFHEPISEQARLSLRRMSCFRCLLKIEDSLLYLAAFTTLGKFSRLQIDDIYVSCFSPEIDFDISCKETICMKCQSLYSGKIWKIFQNVVCWIFYSACLVLNQKQKPSLHFTGSWHSKSLYFYRSRVDRILKFIKPNLRHH